jgi:alkylated DNA repair dioxygenase AlkB
MSEEMDITERVDLGLAGASLTYVPRLFDPEDVEPLLQEALETTPWRQESVLVYGRRHPQPRLTAWFADDGAGYTYSGLTLPTSSWTRCLGQIRGAVERVTGIRFPAALANLYRDGRDSVSWHADDEPELGPTPVIASVTLGAARPFQLRRRDDRAVRREIVLASGSLLVMAGETQRNWVHQIPKTTRQVGPRVNVTFRTWAALGSPQRR